MQRRTKVDTYNQTRKPEYDGVKENFFDYSPVPLEIPFMLADA